MDGVVEEQFENIEEDQVQLIYTRPFHAQVQSRGGEEQLVLVLPPVRLSYTCEVIDKYGG
jgi:hypothetical protein